MTRIIIKKTILIVLLFIYTLLGAYDLNITKDRTFIKINSQNDQYLLFVQAVDTAIKTNKQELDKIYNDNTTLNYLIKMDKFFGNIREDKLCSVTYKYKQAHFFIFNCKDKKRDKIYKFKKDNLDILISIGDTIPWSIDSIKSIEVVVKELHCGVAYSYTNTHNTFCRLYIKGN